MGIRNLLTTLALAMGAAALSAPASHAQFPDGATEIPAEDLLLIETTKGDVLVALNAEFAPNHVERVKRLSRFGFYDGLSFHRVIDGFMAQGGSAELSGRSPFNGPSLQAEFTQQIALGFDPISIGEVTQGELRIGEASFSEINGMSVINGYPSDGALSLYNGYLIFHEPVGLAALRADGRITVNLQHCPGVASMARLGAPPGATPDEVREAENSATTQFFLMRDPAPWLDRQYSPWGRTVAGQAAINALTVTEDGPAIPDRMTRVRLVSDLPESERPRAAFLPVDRDAVASAVATAATQTEGFDFDACAFMPEVVIENFPAG